MPTKPRRATCSHEIFFVRRSPTKIAIMVIGNHTKKGTIVPQSREKGKNVARHEQHPRFRQCLFPTHKKS